MPEMLSIINCLKKYFPRNFATFLPIIEAMLCMSGTKTMLNISRWSSVSYKTLERFYDRMIPWLEMNWILLRHFASSQEFLLTSDETVVTKAGKRTHGLDYFFSSLLKKPIKSLCFSGIALIHPQKKRSYPLLMNQLVFTPEEKEQAKALKEHKKQAKGKKRGRPKGSKNNKKEKPLAPTFRLLKEQLSQVQRVVSLGIQYFVGDGTYGNKTCAKICQEFGYDLISKLQYNSALYFKYEGDYQGRGRPKIYGQRVLYDQLPERLLVHQEEDKQTITKIYHLSNILNASFDCPLNVVIIQKHTENKMAQVILFSTDLGLDYQTIIDYYSARFQIEFNFRDAKQFWGLEDFMNIKEIRVHNAANLAFFMVTLSTLLLDKFRIFRQNSAIGVRDLIAFYRADRYYQETLKLLWKFNPDILIPNTNEDITSLGVIHV
jgi:putative transposase